MSETLHNRTPISDVITEESQLSSVEVFEILDIQSNDELTVLLESPRINFVDCYADWCGPCKRIYPSYKKMSEEYSSNQNVRFFKLKIDNKDENIQEFVLKNDITSIPFFLMVENGETTKTFSNFVEMQDYIKKNF